jgi:thiol-disulfide isomerase/thioredoxin
MTKGKAALKKDNWNQLINILVIFSLVVLLFFTFIYVYNITTHKESFVNSEYKVVYVYSETCPHCVAFTPIWDQYLATQNSNSKVQFLKVEKINAQQYMSYIDGFPTVLVFASDGTLVKKQVGKVTLEQLQAFVNAATQRS